MHDYFGYLFFAILLSFMHIFVSFKLIRNTVLVCSIVLFGIFTYYHFQYIEFKTSSLEELTSSIIHGLLLLVVLYYIFQLSRMLF